MIFFFSYQRITVLLLAVHYIADMLQHGSRLMHFVQRKENLTKSKSSFETKKYIILLNTNFFFSIIYHFQYSLRNKSHNDFDPFRCGVPLWFKSNRTKIRLHHWEL